MSRKKKTVSASRILYNRYIKDDPEMQSLLEEAREDATIARKIYALRKAAGLTQRELADMIGTQTSAISRLEDADYEGHSLPILRKIAKALNTQLRVDFVPLEGTEAA